MTRWRSAHSTRCTRLASTCPGSVSVVGYDDDPVAAYLIPALTTVRQDFSALASGCLTQLLSLVGGADDTVVQQIIAPELIVRASTAPPIEG